MPLQTRVHQLLDAVTPVTNLPSKLDPDFQSHTICVDVVSLDPEVPASDVSDIITKLTQEDSLVFKKNGEEWVGKYTRPEECTLAGDSSIPNPLVRRALNIMTNIVNDNTLHQNHSVSPDSRMVKIYLRQHSYALTSTYDDDVSADNKQWPDYLTRPQVVFCFTSAVPSAAEEEKLQRMTRMVDDNDIMIYRHRPNNPTPFSAALCKCVTSQFLYEPDDFSSSDDDHHDDDDDDDDDKVTGEALTATLDQGRKALVQATERIEEAVAAVAEHEEEEDVNMRTPEQPPPTERVLQPLKKKAIKRSRRTESGSSSNSSCGSRGGGDDDTDAAGKKTRRIAAGKKKTYKKELVL